MNICIGLVDRLVPRAGRKTINAVALTFILCMLTAVVANRVGGFQRTAAGGLLLRVCAMSAAAMCSQLYVVNSVVTSELFPTAIRSLAASFMQVSNRMGGVVSPHIFLLVG